MKRLLIFSIKVLLSFIGVGAIVIVGILLLKNSPTETRVIETKYTKTAVFSMGCFLTSQSVFFNRDSKIKYPGILSIRAGYATGKITGSKSSEAKKRSIKVIYNPSIISYDQLLTIFWHNIDPFNPKGQFCDIGNEYTAAIFYTDHSQEMAAEHSKKRIEFQLSHKVVTPILKLETFYDAEERYQNFFTNNPLQHIYLKWRCNRDKPLNAIWGDVSYLN